MSRSPVADLLPAPFLDDKVGMTETALSEQDRLTRLEELREENQTLTQEVEGLRLFMDSMARLIEAVERPKRESEALSLLSQVLDTAIRAIGARDGSLLVPDDETGELVFVLVQGSSTKANLVGRRLPACIGHGSAATSSPIRWIALLRAKTRTSGSPRWTVRTVASSSRSASGIRPSSSRSTGWANQTATRSKTAS